MRQDLWEVAKWWPAETNRPGYWEKYKQGTKAECDAYIQHWDQAYGHNKSQWYNGEKLVLFRVSYTAVSVFEAEVKVKREDL